MADYSFTTRWHVEAPIESVWEAIHAARDWPRWWTYVQRVTVLEEGAPDGVGQVQRQEWRTALPYSFVFDARVVTVERPHHLAAETVGELSGTGRWQLSEDGPVTVVRYDWNVRTTKGWMNALAPVARPIFAWNHRTVMDEGGAGLARWLGTRLASPSVHTVNTVAPATG
jgi:uncharacterized protein YndB with AHSA1/START domain